MRAGTRSTRVNLAAAASLVLAATLLTARAPTGNSEKERLATVVAAVTAADDRVIQVSAEESVDGFSFGWTIDVVLAGSEPVTPDELSALLLAARHAGDDNPGHLNLFATDKAGEVVDLTAAADGLGLRYSDFGSGIAVTRDLLDDALGTGR